MNIFLNFKLKWHKALISQFIDSNYEIMLENSYTIYIKNVLNSNLDLNDKYGFITIKFINNEKKVDFLKFIDFEYKYTTIENGLTIIGYKYDKIKYPCKIYPDSSPTSISFYSINNLRNITVEDEVEYCLNILQTLKKDIENYIK